jgi:RNA polymerase sigma factor (sigma-70 family)
MFSRLRRKPTDQAEWQEFTCRILPRIRQWAARYLPANERDDVAQMVLLRFCQALEGFEYDPRQRFRGWLRTLTGHAVVDWLKSRERPGRGSGAEDAYEVLESEAAREDLWGRIEREYDLELFEEACRRVRLRVQPVVWQRYWLTVPAALGGGGREPEEAAAEAGVKVALIYQARSRVSALLTAELARLDGDAS